MKHRLGSLLIGGGALALALLGAPAVSTGALPASQPPGHHPGPSAQTFTLTPTGTDVRVVGTTAWTPTKAAGASGTGAVSGSTTIAAAKNARPRISDVGETPRSTAPVGSGGTPSPRKPGPGLTGPPGPHQHPGPGQHGGTGPAGNVAGPTPGLSSVAGIDAYGQGVLHPTPAHPQTLPGIDIEPPDQGLCAGNGFVMEVNNAVVQMYSAATMTPLSKNGMALENLFGAPEIFGGGQTGSFSVQGDPRCYFDPQTNRWFASQIWLTEADGSSLGWGGEFVAVSTSAAPTGTWRSYFIPDQFDAQGVDHCNNLPPATLPSKTNPTGKANPCYGDQPLLGVNGNAVFISTNEYTLAGAHPVGGVAAEYALSKSDLVNGIASPIYWGHLGDTVAQPGNPTCPYNTPGWGQSTQTICPWYSITPAVSDGAYVTSTGGNFYAMSTTTFVTNGSHGVGLWKFTNTDAVTNGGPHVTGAVTVVTTVPYAEPPHSTVHGSYLSSQGLASQKLGPHPLGTLWKTFFGVTPISWPTGEGMIATNTDRIATAAYDPQNGSVWGALNTASPGGTTAAIAWFSVTPHGSGSALGVGPASSGFLWARGVSDFFPSIAFTNQGSGVMDYAMSGTSMFPSTGYSTIGPNGPTNTLHVARAGAGPEDGFSEYTATYNRPRFGDYSTSVATGGTFFFSSEMINQSCTATQFEATFTCGGTRDALANWGTSVNKLSSGHGHGPGH
jgi:hypothetical protein